MPRSSVFAPRRVGHRLVAQFSVDRFRFLPSRLAPRLSRLERDSPVDTFVVCLLYVFVGPDKIPEIFQETLKARKIAAEERGCWC